MFPSPGCPRIVAYARDPVRRPLMLGKGPVDEDVAVDAPVVEAIFAGQLDEGFRRRADGICLAAILADTAGRVEREDEALRMSQLAGEGERLLHGPERLIGVSEQPQHERKVGFREHPRMSERVTEDKGLRAVFERIVELDRPFQVGAGCRQPPEVIQGLAHGAVGLDEQGRILGAVGKA